MGHCSRIIFRNETIPMRNHGFGFRLQMELQIQHVRHVRLWLKFPCFNLCLPKDTRRTGQDSLDDVRWDLSRNIERKRSYSPQ